jgi:predicted DNA-binding transcriptional regulator YafY
MWSGCGVCCVALRIFREEKMAKSVLLLRALELLRTNQGLTVTQLAAELNRSERTVYRYLAELGYELNSPVYCDGGVYRLAARNDAATVFNLTADEALAAHIALNSLSASAPEPLGQAARSALRKIESTVRNNTFDQLRDCQRKHLVEPSVLSNSSMDTAVVSRISEAVKSNRRLKVVYRSQKSAKTENLIVDPYGLAFKRHSWYLVVYSHSHEQVIQLKLIRIQQAEDTDETFQRPSDFCLQDFYRGSWEVWAGGEETSVRIRFSPCVAPMIRENSYHPSQQIEDTPDGGAILSVTVAGTEEIGSWILSYGPEAEALEPAGLRERIRRAAAEIAEVYKDGAKTGGNGSEN